MCLPIGGVSGVAMLFIAMIVLKSNLLKMLLVAFIVIFSLLNKTFLILAVILSSPFIELCSMSGSVFSHIGGFSFFIPEWHIQLALS